MSYQYITGVSFGALIAMTFAFPIMGKSTSSAQQLQVQIGSNLALMAGNHLWEARKRIGANEPDTARDELIKALTLLDVMEDQAAIPTVKARLDYIGKQLEYESPQKLEAGFVPVFGELNIITDEKNNKEAKKHWNKAMKSLKKGDREAAREELKKIDKLITYEVVSVPVDTTRKHMKEAMAAIERKELPKAKQSVELAQTSFHDDIIVVLDREGKRSGVVESRQPAE